jgi:capsular exopolysaccharide synthesis family protein
MRFSTGKPVGDPASNHVTAPGRNGEAVAPPTPKETPAAAASPNPWGHALRRCWPLALALGLLGGMAAAAPAWLLAPAPYSAQAVIEISARPPKGSWEGQDDFTLFKNTQAAMIKSASILSATLDKPGIRELKEISGQEDPVGWLQKNLTTDFVLGPSLLRVTLNAENPDDAAALLNAVCEAYVSDYKKRDEDRTTLRITVLKANRDANTKELAEKRQILRNRRSALGIEDEEIQKRDIENAQKREEVTLTKLTEVQLEIKKLKIEVESVSNATLDAELEQNKSFQEASKKDLEDMTQAEERLRNKEKIPDPVVRKVEVEKAKRNVEEVKARYDALKERWRAQIAPQVRQKLADKLKLLEQQEKEIDLEAKKWKDEVRFLKNGRRAEGNQTNDLAAAKDAVDQVELAVKKINEELAALQADGPILSRVNVMQPAVPPVTRKTDRQIRFTVGAGVGVFILFFVGAAWFEVRARRVYSTADVSANLGLRLLGALPPYPNGSGHASALVTPAELSELNARTEAADAIRTVLLHGQGHEAPRVILITSAMRGEGRSTLAAHLAASLARSWRKTLLIDGDLRNPAAHRLFDLPQEPGLCDALRGDADFDGAVRPTYLSRLWLMPAGRCDSHAVQALAQETVGTAFEQFKEQYDFILIDAGPVLPVADTLLLGQHADAVVLAVLRDVSVTPTVIAARERLKAVGKPVIGAVVLGTEG